MKKKINWFEVLCMAAIPIIGFGAFLIGVHYGLRMGEERSAALQKITWENKP